MFCAAERTSTANRSGWKSCRDSFHRWIPGYSYQGRPITHLALEFIVHTFVRPGELKSAEWQDFDLDQCLWRIPAEKMKMKEEHLVHLSERAVQILEEVRDRTGRYSLVFPNSHNYNKIMSENTLTYAIRKRLGFDVTAHGFRTTVSTILNEKGFEWT